MRRKFPAVLAALAASIFVSISAACTAAETSTPTPYVENSINAFQVWNNSGTEANEFCVVLKGVHEYDLDRNCWQYYCSNYGQPTVGYNEDEVIIQWKTNGYTNAGQSEIFAIAFCRPVSVTNCEMYWSINGNRLETIDDVRCGWSVANNQVNCVVNNNTGTDRYIRRSGGYYPSQISVQNLVDSLRAFTPIAIDPLTTLTSLNSLSFDFAPYMWQKSFIMFCDVYKTEIPTLSDTPSIRFATAANMASPSGVLTLTKNIDIADRLLPTTTEASQNNEMLSLLATAGSYEDITLSSIQLWAWNTDMSVDPTNVISADIWKDVNNDGKVDPLIDEKIGSGSYTTSSNQLTLNLNSPLTISAGTSASLLISYTLKPSIAAGTEFGFTAGDVYASGNTSGSRVPVTYEGGMDSAYIIVGPDHSTSISEAKMIPIDPTTGASDTVLFENCVITANFQSTTGLIYIEDVNRSSGIGVIMSDNDDQIPVDTKVSVMGRLRLLNGTELVLDPDFGELKESASISPVAMSNKSTGGGTYGNQPAVINNTSVIPAIAATGLNNVGMLVRTCGEVTGYGQIQINGSAYDAMWIDDGSGLVDGISGYTGIAVMKPQDWPDNRIPSGTMAVTGILSAIPNQNGLPVRLLIPRSESDAVSF